MWKTVAEVNRADTPSLARHWRGNLARSLPSGSRWSTWRLWLRYWRTNGGPKVGTEWSRTLHNGQPEPRSSEFPANPGKDVTQRNRLSGPSYNWT